MAFLKSITEFILFEDDWVIVLWKPAGLMVEPDRNGNPSLLQEVKQYLTSKVTEGSVVYAQHIHRIDRPVSGIVLFAKQRSVLKNLSEQFAQRKVKKYYQALTSNAPLARSGALINWHRKEKKRAAIYDNEIEYTEQVKLNYSISQIEEHRYYWNIELLTGKYHQIRGQLSHINCPIIGDSVYGSTLAHTSNGIALNACRLEFAHPITNQPITVVKEVEFSL